MTDGSWIMVQTDKPSYNAGETIHGSVLCQVRVFVQFYISVSHSVIIPNVLVLGIARDETVHSIDVPTLHVGLSALHALRHSVACLLARRGRRGARGARRT